MRDTIHIFTSISISCTRTYTELLRDELNSYPYRDSCTLQCIAGGPGALQTNMVKAAVKPLRPQSTDSAGKADNRSPSQLAAAATHTQHWAAVL
jgi:hypothetical protein